MKLPRNISISIERNPHAPYHDTIAQYVEQNGDAIDITPDELALCIESGELWLVTWSPETPVGSCCVGASTMERALALAVEGDE